MTRRPIDEAEDIQGLVKTGFGSLDHARYILLRVVNADAARIWLRRLPIVTARQCVSGHVEEALQIAFTASGLEAVGFNADEEFAPEFLDGMAGSASRSRRLGDVGENAPDKWEWGVGEREPHVLLMAFARDDRIEAMEQELQAAAAASGCTQIDSLASTDMEGREPFGFADGISQPKLDWWAELQPGGAKDRDYRNTMAAGEVLLDYSNEYDFVADHPRKGRVGRNGTYLVYRQLEQDVTGFWSWVENTAGHGRGVWLAERMVGRRIDGGPLDGVTQTERRGGRNAFLFADDPEGRACPMGSHIRRANPRMGDDPHGRSGFLKDLISSLGLRGEPRHDAVASSRFHRILRRGRAYGTTLSPAEASKPGAALTKTGLHFLSLNASFARQFEFIQSAWIAYPTFAGLAGEQDPLLGNRHSFPDAHPGDTFSYWDEKGDPRRVSSVPQFVAVKGGAYFFMPGVEALGKILSD